MLGVVETRDSFSTAGWLLEVAHHFHHFVVEDVYGYGYSAGAGAHLEKGFEGSSRKLPTSRLLRPSAGSASLPLLLVLCCSFSLVELEIVFRSGIVNHQTAWITGRKLRMFAR